MTTAPTTIDAPGALTAADARRLLRLNVVVGLAHLAQAMLILLLAKPASLPVGVSYLTGPPGSGDYGGPASLFDLRIDLAVAAFLLLAAIDHLAVASRWARRGSASNLQRCTNPENPDWPNYGGRGICVHGEWVKDPSAFFDHIGPRPAPGMSINRVDNDRDYVPGNVEWATPKQQQQNTRQTVVVELDGERVSFAEAARRRGVPLSTAAARRDRGLSVEAELGLGVS
jgi:hypothetical protein